MPSIREKEGQIKSKFKAIIQSADTKASDAEKKLKQFDNTVENIQSQIASSLGDFGEKVKKKLPNTDNIFDRITRDLDQILPKKDGQSLLRTATRQAIKETSDQIKPIFLSNVRKLFFANDSDFGCGTQTLIPYSGITISPKEFDYLDILQTDPLSNLGKIVYENSITPSKVKMNKIFYETFTTPYNFLSEDEVELFKMEWNAGLQKYSVSGLTDSNLTVDQFITKYYESIEFPKISDVIKATFSMLVPIGDAGVTTTPGGKTNSSFDEKINKLMRSINKIMAFCDKKNDTLNQSAANQFPEETIDVFDFFNFDDVEGIDLDDESRRYQKVLRFVDCNNYDFPVNQRIVEDFAFFASTKNEIVLLGAYDDALAKISKEASNSNGKLPTINFNLSLGFQSLKLLPKALLSVVVSPKFFFPIAVLWKMFKEATINTLVKVETLMKNIGKFLYNTLKDIYNKFLEIFWRIVKPQIALIVKDLVKRIMKNSKKRYRIIVLAIIDLLAMAYPFIGVKNCDDFYNAILQVLNYIRVGVRQNINGFLLQLAKGLPGYSEDRAMMNVGELLEANGIPTGDLFGQENNVMKFVASILKGHQKEMDENSFVQVSLDYAQIPVAPLGGAAVIPPGILKAHGKLT